MHVIGWIIAGASTAVRLLTVADRTLRGAASLNEKAPLTGPLPVPGSVPPPAGSLIQPSSCASDGRPRALWTQPVPDETDQMLESQVIVTAIRSLSEDHRRVLLEVYYRRRPVAEAAAILSLPPRTVKLLTYDALRALKAVLDAPPPPR